MICGLGNLCSSRTMISSAHLLLVEPKIVPGQTEASAELSDAVGTSLDQNPATEVETPVEQDAY